MIHEFCKTKSPKSKKQAVLKKVFTFLKNAILPIFWEGTFQPKVQKTSYISSKNVPSVFQHGTSQPQTWNNFLYLYKKFTLHISRWTSLASNLKISYIFVKKILLSFRDNCWSRHKMNNQNNQSFLLQNNQKKNLYHQ